MSLRLTLILVIVLSWASVGTAYLVKNPPSAAKDPDPPFFYTLSSDDIRRIQIRSDDQAISWVHRDDFGRWFFSQPVDLPADLNRWGGITTLLGGPKTQRILQKNIDDPAKYGLDTPQTSITVSLRDGTDVKLDIGDKTPSGESHYAKLVGYPQLVLVDSTWGDVLRRLVIEPPYPEWWYTMNPSEATEMLFFEKNDIVRAYGMNRDERKWYVCALPVQGEPCTGTEPADQDKINQALQLIADRQITGVAKMSLTDPEDYVPYEATVNEPYFAIRIERKSPDSPNITNVYRTSMTIGGLTADGSERYVVANETQDVARATREWTDRLLELFHGDVLAAVPAAG